MRIASEATLQDRIYANAKNEIRYITANDLYNKKELKKGVKVIVSYESIEDHQRVVKSYIGQVENVCGWFYVIRRECGYRECLSKADIYYRHVHLGKRKGTEVNKCPKRMD